MLCSKRIKEFVSPVYFYVIPLIFVSSLYLACCKQSCGLHQNNLKSISFIRIKLEHIFFLKLAKGIPQIGAIHAQNLELHLA